MRRIFRLLCKFLLLVIDYLHSSCTYEQILIESKTANITLTGHSTGIECLAVSNDGKMITSGGGWDNGEIKIWCSETGKELTPVNLIAPGAV